MCGSILAASKKVIADIFVISELKSNTLTFSPAFKLYLKVFLFTGVPFGLFMMIFDLIDGTNAVFWRFLIQTATFGGIMSLLFVTAQLRRLKSKGFSMHSEGALRVRQEAQIPTHLTRQELIDMLKQDPVFGKLKMTETADGIEFTTKTTWLSWGEKVKLRIIESGTGENILEVSSRPLLLTTLIDYGQNKVNIDRIEKLVSTAM